MDSPHLIALAISLGLGLLVGLQRQWKDSEVAGIRTFPLITLLGTLSVLLDTGGNYWLCAAGLLGVTRTTRLGKLCQIQSRSLRLRHHHRDRGTTNVLCWRGTRSWSHGTSHCGRWHRGGTSPMEEAITHFGFKALARKKFGHYST